MAKNDFKYIIQTDLKFSPGSLNNLLQEAKVVDRAIRTYFSKNNMGVKLPVGIDKNASRTIQTDVSRIVTNYNNGQAPSIKLGVKIDLDSVENAKRQVSILKQTLNNLDNNSKPLDIRTSLQVSRGDKQKLQQEVGKIKSTMTVGLKLDRNDLKVIESQIRSIRAEMQTINTPVANARSGENNRGLRRFGAHRDESTVSTVSGQVSSRTVRGSKAEIYARNRREIMGEIRQLKDNLKLSNDAQEIQQKISDLENSKANNRKSRSWKTQNGTVEKVMAKDFDKRISEYKAMVRQAESIEKLQKELNKKEDILRKLDSNAFHGSKTVSTKLPAHHGVAKRGLAMLDEAKRMNEEVDAIKQATNNRQKAMDKYHQQAIAFQNQSAKVKYKEISSAHRQAIGMNTRYDNAKDKTHARAITMNANFDDRKANQALKKQQQMDRLHQQAIAFKAQSERAQAREIDSAHRRGLGMNTRHNEKRDQTHARAITLNNRYDNAKDKEYGRAIVMNKRHDERAMNKAIKQQEQMNRLYQQALAFQNKTTRDKHKELDSAHRQALTMNTRRDARLDSQHAKAIGMNQKYDNTKNKEYGQALNMNARYDEKQMNKALAQQKAMNRLYEQALTFQSKTEQAKARAIEHAHRQAIGMNKRYDKNMDKTHARAITMNANYDNRKMSDAHNEALKYNRVFDKLKTYNQNDTEWNNNIHRYGGNKQKQIRDEEMVLRNPDASTADKTRALENLKQHASTLARTMNQELTRSFEVFNRNADGTISRTRTAQYEFTRFGDAIDRSNKFMNTLRNTTMYTGISALFFGMAQGIALSVSHMAEFESQMARIQMIATDLSNSDGELKGDFSQWGDTRSKVGNNARRDVYDIAQRYGMSVNENVMPVYQQVMSRTALTQDENGKPNRETTKQITDQVLKYSMITLGPSAQAGDITRISQDMLSLYQGMYKEGSQEHLGNMDKFVDFMAVMNNSGVNTNNIMDTMSEIAPDALKKGIDPRQIAGMLGAYNLADGDASGANMTTVAKTFFGGIGKARESASVQKGLKTMGIDIDSNPNNGGKRFTEAELIDEVIKKYAELNDTDKQEVGNALSSVTGKGISQGPKIQRFLDATGSEYYKAFQEQMNTTGTADTAMAQYIGTLKVQFGSLKGVLGETVELFAELGALDGLKALVGGFKAVMTVVNSFLDIIVRLGDASEKMFGGFNIPKFVTQLASLAMGFKLLTLAMKKTQIGTGVANAVGNVIGNITAGQRVAGVMTSVPVGTLNGRQANLRRPTPTVVTPHTGKGTGIGSAIGSIAGWVVAGKIMENPKKWFGKGKGAEVGANVTGNLLNNFGKGLANVLPALLKFGGLITRLSLLGAAIGAVAFVGKKVYDLNKERKQKIADSQIKNFKNNYVNEEGITNTGLVKSEIEKWREYNTTSQHSGYALAGNKDKVPKDIQKLQKKFSAMGIEYHAPTQMVSYIPAGKDGKQGKVQSFRGDDEKGWNKMEKILGQEDLNAQVQVANAWDKARESAFQYETELSRIDDLTSEFNKSMNRLGYDLGTIDMNFMGAENSTGATSAKIGVIRNAMSELSGTIGELEEKRAKFSERATAINSDKSALRSEIIGDKRVGYSEKDMAMLDQEYKLAYDAGNLDTILNRYTVNDDVQAKWKKDGLKPKEIEDKTYQYNAINEYLAYTQENKGFLDAEKQTEEQILATNIAIQERNAMMKQLEIQLGISASKVDVFNAKIQAIQFGTGKAKTLYDMSNSDEERVKLGGDLLKTQSAEVNAYRAQLASVQAQMNKIKSGSKDDFSTDALYDPQGELTTDQAVYKDLLDKQYGIHNNINSSTLAMHEQAKTMKELILNSDKYADVWERVQNRIQMVKDMNREITSTKIDMNLAPHLAQVKSAITGGSVIGEKNSRYQSIRDNAFEGFEKLRTALETYDGDDAKLKEAYEEINKSMGSEFDNAFIQPLKDLIASDFKDAGNLIAQGAESLDAVLAYWANNITSGILTQGNSDFTGDISSATPIGGFTGGAINRTSSTMTDTEAINAYIEQQFGYRVGTKQHTQMKKQMSIEMTPREIASEARRNITTTENNGNVHAYAEDIDKMFKGTKLAGYGNQYVQAGAKHNIDPRLMAAISMAETGGDSAALRDKNNIAGEMMRGGGLRSFDSIGDSIESMASFLRRLYFDNGKDTLPEIQASYAPNGATNDPTDLNSNWLKNVANYYGGMTGQAPSTLIGGSAISSTGGASGSSRSNLKKGSKGEDVKALQKALGIKVDGDYGNQTYNAVLKYQKSKGLTADGRVGPQTWGSLGLGGGSSTTQPTGGSYDNKATQKIAKHYMSNGYYFSAGLGDGRGHNGVDITKPGSSDRGDPIYAFMGGKVEKAGYHKEMGNYAYIKQADGSIQKYMHMLEGLNVKVGQTVKAGDTIGKLGSTGHSTGDHLHYEMRDKNNKVLDAKKYVQDWAAGKNLPKTAQGAIQTPDGKDVPTYAETVKLMFEKFKQMVQAQMAIDNVGAINESYTNDRDNIYGHGNIRDVLGSSGRTGVYDRIQQSREEIFTARYNNENQLEQLAKTRKGYAKDANSALKAGKTDEYNANKEAVEAIDKLVKALTENNKKLKDQEEYLKKQAQRDPRLNSEQASKFIRGGYDKINSFKGNNKGSVDYYRSIEETNRMNGEYMTTRKKAGLLSELWNNSGQQTRQYNMVKRQSNQEDLNIMFEKMKQIGGVLKEFAQGSADWYATLEDAVAVQEELRDLEQQRLTNAQSMFELTGQGLQAYIGQKAYTQSKDYVQAGNNLESTKKQLETNTLQKGYGVKTGTYKDKDSAQKVADFLKNDYNVEGKVTKNKDGTYRVSTGETLTKERSEEIQSRLKKRKLAKTTYTTGGGTEKMDATEQLVTMQVIAGLHDQMIQQMNDYRSAVVGAFKAGALSLEEYLAKLNDLRDVQNEQRESAIQMVDTISAGFEQSLSNALSSGMMGNMDSTKGFMDSIKQTLATTISGTLSSTLINNTGLQTVMNDLITSITTAATSGDPNDIANMFNGDNFGEQIQNAMNPFLPLIEQIVASTDGIFSIMKDQLFNAPEGFKIDQYLYDQAKGKTFEGVKTGQGDGTNQAGSPISGVGENTPIVTPPSTTPPPAGVPDTTTTPVGGTPGTTGAPPNTTPGGTGAPTSPVGTTPPPDTTKVNEPAKKKAPPKTGGSGGGSTNKTYTVKKGDSFWEIENKLGLAHGTLAKLNPGVDSWKLKIGQKLIVGKTSGGSSGGSGGASTSTKTTKSALNMRSSASYNGKVMTVLPKGAKVQYHGIENGWAKVGYKGKTGYVGRSYIYHTGGIAGTMNFANSQKLKADEVQAIMQRGEIALQPKQLSSLLGHTAPKATSEGGGGFNLSITVNVDGGSYDQKGIESAVETSVEKAMAEFNRQQRLSNLTWKGTSY